MKESWDDWLWQFSNRITKVDELRRYVDLSDEEAEEINNASASFRWCITPYYASLMDRKDRECPIRKQAIPSILELDDEVGSSDPLHEEKHSPTEGLIHLYPDRVAFCVTQECAMYCRHCVRKRMVGQRDRRLSMKTIEKGIEYIREHEEIRDVLITGGDPLTASDRWIDELLKRVRAIPHVEIIRIGTRVPCTMPQRITDSLCEVLSKYHPLWINTQFNHPKELTEEAAAACDKLLRAGIPLGNQSVLLKGINDDPDVMKKLLHGLLKMRVRPYYLYQCEVLKGTKHFRTPVEVGMNIIDRLQGYTSGISIPTFVVDSPIGKVPIHRDNIIERGKDYVTLRNFKGETWTLHSPSNEEYRREECHREEYSGNKGSDSGNKVISDSDNKVIQIESIRVSNF